MTTQKTLCINDGAYVGAAAAQAAANFAEALLWTAVYAAGMAAKRKASGQIADMEAELNQRRLDLAKKIASRARTADGAAGAVVGIAMSEAPYSPMYGPTQAVLVEGAVREEHARVLADHTLGRMGITLNQCDISRIERGLAIGRTDMASHTMRAAEARAEALNDRRNSRQQAATGLGRGASVPPIPVGSNAIASMNGVVDSIARTFNSGMALWGYSSNRNSYGGNFVTGNNQSPTVVPNWVVKPDTSTPVAPTIVVENVIQTNDDGYAVAIPAEEM